MPITIEDIEIIRKSITVGMNMQIKAPFLSERKNKREILEAKVKEMYRETFVVEYEIKGKALYTAFGYYELKLEKAPVRFSSNKEVISR